jgi:tetratricopeptide (TPR) repeat protein
MWPAELARLCPAVEQRWDRAPGEPPADPALGRARLFESVLQALEWGAAQRPLIFVLEDLQLADASSLALVAHAGRRLTGLRALVLVTYRSGRRAELEAALGALRRTEALVGEVGLGPLSERDVEAIVERTAPALAAGVRRRTVAAAEGNPLLAVHGARAALAGADPGEALRGFVRAPRERLPAGARLLVDLAAVGARPLELGEAAELVGPERLPDALAEAVAANLLESDARRLRFPHALVRDACYAEVAPARRPSLHGRLAGMLAARPRSQVAEVARHLLLAGDEERARTYLARAAEKARAVGALEEASGFLAEAAKLASDAVAPELWLGLAEIEAWRGHREDHDAAFERALAPLEQAEDSAGLARAWATRGRLLRTTLCYPLESLAAYRRALEIIDAAGVDAPELRALALAGAAWAEATAGELSAATALIAEVERLPEAAGDPALRGELELDRATALVRAGHFAAGEEAGRAAAELAREAESAELRRVALSFAAAAASARGAFERALEYARLGNRSAAAGTRLEVESLAAQAYALSRLGRHPEAILATRRMRTVAGRSGEEELEAIAAFDAGSVALAAGEHEHAAVFLDEALGGSAQRLPRALARLRLAEARVRAGDPDAAAEEIGRLPYEPVSRADLPETLVPQLARLQGLVAHARGDHDQALRRLAEAEAGWRRVLDRFDGGDALAGAVVDLGRAPVSGLIEIRLELGRVLAERALVLADAGRFEEGEVSATKAERLAREASFEGYAETLLQGRTLIDRGAEHAKA